MEEVKRRGAHKLYWATDDVGRHWHALAKAFTASAVSPTLHIMVPNEHMMS